MAAKKKARTKTKAATKKRAKRAAPKRRVAKKRAAAPKKKAPRRRATRVATERARLPCSQDCYVFVDSAGRMVGFVRDAPSEAAALAAMKRKHRGALTAVKVA